MCKPICRICNYLRVMVRRWRCAVRLGTGRQARSATRGVATGEDEPRPYENNNTEMEGDLRNASRQPAQKAGGT